MLTTVLFILACLIFLVLSIYGHSLTQTSSLRDERIGNYVMGAAYVFINLATALFAYLNGNL